MKKYYLLVVIVAFASCNSEQNDFLSDLGYSNVNEKMTDFGTSSNELSLLSFISEEAFLDAVEALDTLEINERKEWVKQHYGSFYSLEDLYDKAMIDANALDESKEAFIAYKEKYQEYLYFANYLDDCGAYLPISNRTMASLLNIHGEVRICGVVKNLRDINSYTDLQTTGRSMYDYGFVSENPSREWNPSYIYHSNIIGYESSDNVGQEFDSGWWVESKRKLRVKCGRKIRHISSNRYKIELHLELSFRKKTWVGWVNYSSTTTTTGDFFGGYTGSINYSKSADSSHDWYQKIPYHCGRTPEGCLIVYSDPISANLTIDYRGFTTPKTLLLSIDSLAAIGNPDMVIDNS